MRKLIAGVSALIMAGLCAPRANAEEFISCAALIRERDHILAENLYAYFCADPRGGFTAAQTQEPAFVARHFAAAGTGGVGAPPPVDDPRNDPNQGGGGGRAY
jgi:hypothetical protein